MRREILASARPGPGGIACAARAPDRLARPDHQHDDRTGREPEQHIASDARVYHATAQQACRSEQAVRPVMSHRRLRGQIHHEGTTGGEEGIARGREEPPDLVRRLGEMRADE